MKKLIVVALAVFLLAGALVSCDSKNGKSSGYKDGSYRVEGENFDSHGWKPYINVVVKDGMISQVEFDYINQDDGRMKTEDEAYKEAMLGAGNSTYPADFTEKLENALIEKQDAKAVDTVSGATHSSEDFKSMMTKLQDAMTKGNTDTLMFKN